MKLSIIIPVFNEQATIEEIIEKVKNSKINGLVKEIVVVDDGSSDNTRKVLAGIKDKNLDVILHESNKGKGAAIKTGLSHATGDLFIIQDADLEYNPDDYECLISPIIEGKSEVVYGSRFIKYPLKLTGRKKTPMISHYFGNKLLTFLTNLLYGSSVSDMETGYKVFTRKVYESISLSSNRFDFEPEVTAQILKRGFKIEEVPITFKPRSYNQGKKISWRDGIKAIYVLLVQRFK